MEHSLRDRAGLLRQHRARTADGRQLRRAPELWQSEHEHPLEIDVRGRVDRHLPQRIRPAPTRSGSTGTYGSGSTGTSGSGSTGTYGSGSTGTYGGGTTTTSSGPSRARSGGAGIGLGGGLCCLLAFVGVIGFVLLSSRKKAGGSSAGAAPGGPSSYGGPDAMYVGQLSLGVDWRARRELQAALSRLAESGDTQSAQGLAHLLRETVLALRRAELSWLYVSQKNVGPIRPQDAEGQFDQLTLSARSAFQQELVRGAGGQVTTQAAPEMRANPNEGEGTVVVHLIVASYRPLATLQGADAAQLRRRSRTLAALTADQLAALEVVWSPAAEDDRMSTAELEQFYPDMRLIDPNSIAGRVFCTYCRGPFAMELLRCPHCGAPAEDSRENRAPH